MGKSSLKHQINTISFTKRYGINWDQLDAFDKLIIIERLFESLDETQQKNIIKHLQELN